MAGQAHTVESLKQRSYACQAYFAMFAGPHNDYTLTVFQAAPPPPHAQANL